MLCDLIVSLQLLLAKALWSLKLFEFPLLDDLSEVIGFVAAFFREDRSHLKLGFF